MRVVAILGALSALSAGCSADGSGGGGMRDAGDGSDGGGTDAADTGGADSGGSDAGGERCNGFDEDADGEVDEGCPCASGGMQACYPGPSVALGCAQGMQSCDATSAWDATGARVPTDGARACCDALEDLTHEMLDAFLLAYPPDSIPSDWHVLDMGWVPEVMGMRMTEAETVSGDEFINPSRGGVTPENLGNGRDAVRMSAMMRFSVDAADILSMSEPEPTFRGPGDGCMRWGAAWGSILFRTDTGAVQEVVYVYVGICNDGDIEGFYASEFPTEVCPEGTLI